MARYSNTLATQVPQAGRQAGRPPHDGRSDVASRQNRTMRPTARSAACGCRRPARIVPALPAAQGDRRPALAAAAAAMAHGPGHVRPDAGRRGHGARAAEAAAVSGRRDPDQGRSTPDARSLLAALLLVVLALAATRVLLGVVNWVKGLLANKVGVALTFELRSQLVRKLHALGVGYYDRHQVGSLVSRVAYDSEVLHGLLQQITGGFLLQIVQVVAVGVMLFTLNPKLALYTLIPAPLVVGGSLFFWRRVYPNYYRYWDSSSKQAGTLSGMLSGIRVVKAFAQEPREFDRFQPLQRLPAPLAHDRRERQRLVHGHHGAGLQPGRPDRLVRRRPRRAGRPDDARFADGVSGLSGDVLRAALDAVAADDLAHQLHDRLPARVRAARYAASKRNDPAQPQALAEAARRNPLRERVVRLRAPPAGAQGRRFHDSARREDRHRRPQRQRQDDAREPDQPLLRRRLGPRAARRRRRPRTGHQPTSGDTSASCCRNRSCSAARSATTSSTAGPTPAPRRRSPPPAPPRRTTSSSARRWATTPGWANAAPAFPAARRQRVSIARALLYDPQGADPRRSHQQRRHRIGKGDPGSAPRPHARPHHAGHRPSAQHAARLRPHSCLRPGPTDRARHAPAS